MNADMVKLLVIAVVVMTVCLAGIGGWLLPRFGIEGVMATAIGGGIGGAIIALLYQKMIKKA